MNSGSIFGFILPSVQLLAVVVVLSGNVLTQDDRLNAPPPMRSIPPAERTQIIDIKDAKSRIKKTLELADLHLQRAEADANESRYDQSLRELGHYLGLLEDAFSFLSKLNSGDRTKSRDLYKHIEIALRAHGPRLTVMRRATPLEYATRMKEVEDFAREGRTDALNAFYGHTVVRDSRSTKPEEKNKPKDNPPNPERRPR
jgi:hypothetical protein